MTRTRIGMTALIVSTLVAGAAISVGTAAVRMAPDGAMASPQTVYTQSVRNEAKGDLNSAKKSDRLPIAAPSGATYRTIIEPGHTENVSVLTRVKIAPVVVSEAQ